jgi:hypothetical protein
MPLATLRSLARIARSPVVAESRRNLDALWAQLPEPLRTPHQMLGRQGGGCGATIGAMPRCDFACRGCYLGDNANRIPAQSVEEIKRQMRLLRPVLGNAGNVQLTDGEITLRPADEVIELLRYAQSIGLIPMLMTHGDSFRRRPGLLERFMWEGGLVDVSIHVDTTQRGRKGPEWKNPADEAALNPLRDEFAADGARRQAAHRAPAAPGHDDDGDAREHRRRARRGALADAQQRRLPHDLVPADRAGGAHRGRAGRRGERRRAVGAHLRRPVRRRGGARPAPARPEVARPLRVQPVRARAGRAARRREPDVPPGARGGGPHRRARGGRLPQAVRGA